MIGVGKYDGADIPTGHHHTRLAHVSLLRDERVAHARDRRDDRQRIRVVGVVDALRKLGAVSPHALAFDANAVRIREPGHRIRVTWIDAVECREACDRAIHQAAVDERETHLLRHPPAHGGFA